MLVNCVLTSIYFQHNDHSYPYCISSYRLPMQSKMHINFFLNINLINPPILGVMILQQSVTLNPSNFILWMSSKGLNVKWHHVLGIRSLIARLKAECFLWWSWYKILRCIISVKTISDNFVCDSLSFRHK